MAHFVLHVSVKAGHSIVLMITSIRCFRQPPPLQVLYTWLLASNSDTLRRFSCSFFVSVLMLSTFVSFHFDGVIRYHLDVHITEALSYSFISDFPFATRTIG